MDKFLKRDLFLGAYYSNDFRCAQIDEIFKLSLIILPLSLIKLNISSI